MAFISNNDKYGKIGDRVSLNYNVETMSGTFQAGTEMTVKVNGPRGYDLEDDEGHWLCEVSSAAFTKL